MKIDRQIRDEVEAELDWDPSFDSRQVGVAVKDGIVTLSGHVNAFPDRWAAQKAAQSVADVKAIANEIQVMLPFDVKRSDTEIAEAALNAIKSNESIPAAHLKLTVREGWLTVEGHVNWRYQSNAVDTAVRAVYGVKGVDNLIVINPLAVNVSAASVKTKIESAFQRHAHRDAKKIRVTVDDGVVTLEGEVPNWQEREDAQSAAWAAPGISRVDDRLIVKPWPF
jgi:osmotically-inducible protein OsmY